MKTTRNTLDELLNLVREHPPRRPLHSTEELRAITSAADRRPGIARPKRPQGTTATWLAVVAMAITTSGYFALKGPNDIPTTLSTDRSVGIAEMSTRSTPIPPGTATGATAVPLVEQGRHLPSAKGTTTLAGTRIDKLKRNGGRSDGTDSDSLSPAPTPQIQITVTTRDSLDAARHAAAAKPPRNAALDISGIDYLTLTPEELECIGVRKVGTALELTAEEEVVIQSPNDVKEANSLGFETEGGHCIIRSQVRIDTFTVDDVKMRGPCPERFSPLAPVIVINQYVESAASEGSTMYYFDRSPILRRYIGSSKLEKDEFDYIYDASRLDGPQSSGASRNRYTIMSKLIPVYIRIGDEPIAGSNLRRGADVCLWYYPTPEFLSALPDRYRIPLQKELDVIADVEQRKLPEGEVCVRLTGEPTFLGYCRKSAGALAKTGVFPNPASERITCRYTLTAPRDIRISLHDISGRFLRSLGEQESTAGEHDVPLSLKGVESGAYLIAIRTDRGEQAVQRIIVQ